MMMANNNNNTMTYLKQTNKQSINQLKTVRTCGNNATKKKQKKRKKPKMMTTTTKTRDFMTMRDNKTTPSKIYRKER